MSTTVRPLTLAEQLCKMGVGDDTTPEPDMTTRNQYFKRGSAVYKCLMCGKRTRDTQGEGNTELCAACYEWAGWENAHSDNDHEHYPDPGCPICPKAAGA